MAGQNLTGQQLDSKIAFITFILLWQKCLAEMDSRQETLFWSWFQSSPVHDDKEGVERQLSLRQWVCAAEAAHILAKEEVDQSQNPGANITFIGLPQWSVSTTTKSSWKFSSF